MMFPDLKYYARLEYCKESKKTSKYRVVTHLGYYYPMECLRNKNGLIYLYYKRHNSTAPNAPEMNLQAVTNGINITGVKRLLVNGRESNFAYGNPYRNKTFKRNKINPFYVCRNDAFLLVLHKDPDERQPNSIEFIVLNNAKPFADFYCKRLLMGDYDEALNYLREKVKS